MANYPVSRTPESSHNSQNNAPQPTRNNQQQPRASRRGYDAEGEVPTRPRGRPPGSKNKPKPTKIIARETEPALKPHVLEISAGCDVIEALIGFASRLNAGITVLSGVGSISRATIRNPLPPGMAFSVDGPLNLLSLNGSIMAPSVQPSSSSSSSFSGVLPSRSVFTMSVSGADGRVLGGIVAGSIVAASIVTVFLCTFANPMCYRIPSEGENGESNEPCSNGSGAAAVLMPIPNVAATAVMRIPSYAVAAATNPSPISGDPNRMRWRSATPRPPY